MATSKIFFHFFTVSVAFSCLLTVTTEASSTPKRRHITVDVTGKLGDYKRIQDAVDSVPSGNSDPVFIRVEPGTYREKVVVPADKQYITLSGRKANVTVVTWGDSGDIHNSATVTVFASNFVVRYITLQNSHGEGSKAVALRVTGDKAAFYGCRILSYQDTLLDESGRHYYKNCYIEGGTDFIFGNAASRFEKCHLHSISEGDGAITAQRRESATENTGFYFLFCKVTGLKSCLLGRPWGPYSRVVFAYSYMSSVVLPYGWDDWGKPKRRRTVYYGEYGCFGPGANRSKRVDWSRSLTQDEAELFTSLRMIDGTQWLE
ncbi:hypothetical protein V2J09_011687 [Rumex salicifolius]